MAIPPRSPWCSAFPPWLEELGLELLDEGLLEELEGLLLEELGLLELEEGTVEPSQLRMKTQSLYSMSGDQLQ